MALTFMLLQCLKIHFLKKMAKMLSVLDDKKFQKQLEKSPYGFPYNPPGIEFAFALEVFKDDHEKAGWWLNKQRTVTFNSETNDFMTLGSPDPVTSSARIYEAVRLKGDFQEYFTNNQTRQEQ